jgi:SAM-dependent methyltransferase
MTSSTTYLEYVSNAQHMQSYSEYQKRYATRIRESDKVLIELVRGIRRTHPPEQPLALLDIGCSTGNLLLHLKHLVPALTLWGGDMARDVVADCQTNPELAGIRFEEMDVLDLGHLNQFDVVVANVMLFVLGEEQFDRALCNIAAALRSHGRLVAFDYFHPFEQQIQILEKSAFFPEGLPLHMRGYARVETALARAGFAQPVFTPFEIPIDLEPPADRTSIYNSHTVRVADGRRLCFRGVLNQPWCHLVAQKRA